jgi:3D (Asp-Asp-Asp) domain-containing protein
VRRAARLQQRLLALGVCALVAGAAAAAGGADTPSALRQRAAALRAQNASLATRSQQAVLDFYALDAQVARVQWRIEVLRVQAERIRSERASVQRQLRAAKSSLRVSRRELAVRVRALYEQGETDPLAVVLGATSLDEAITGLDDLNRSAALDRRIVAQTKRARTSLTRLSRTLAARDAQIRSLTAGAEASLATLRDTRAARQRYIADLSSQRRLHGTQISELLAQARVSVARAQALAAATPQPAVSVVAANVAAPELGGRTITVSATGYALAGATAIGLPAGRGVVAVDPSVIPLGTRMTIPGYGEGVAADTGSAVQGPVIDLWFPSLAQALAWGRRTVTITLH